MANIKIGGELESIAQSRIVTRADRLFDTEKNNYQSEINKTFTERISSVAGQGRIFSTVADAVSKCPEAKEGDWVLIGTTNPYAVYRHNGTTFVSTGVNYSVGSNVTSDQVSDPSLGETQDYINSQQVRCNDLDSDDGVETNLPEDTSENANYAYNWKIPTNNGTARDGSTSGSMKNLVDRIISLEEKNNQLEQQIADLRQNS